MELTHLNSDGKAAMVDVSTKQVIRRTAKAFGKILLQKETLKLLQDNLLKKGDAIATAKIAGILAAKKTPDLIPLCHGLALEHVDLKFSIVDNGIEIVSSVKASDKTGVEMEALVAVSLAALTIYDMCKAVDKQMKIESVYLLEKVKEEL